MIFASITSRDKRGESGQDGAVVELHGAAEHLGV